MWLECALVEQESSGSQASMCLVDNAIYMGAFNHRQFALESLH